MLLTDKDKALTKNLHQFKECGSRRILTKFSVKNWKREGLDTLLKKIWETGSTDQRHENGRLKHVRTQENVTNMDELAGSDILVLEFVLVLVFI